MSGWRFLFGGDLYVKIKSLKLCLESILKKNRKKEVKSLVVKGPGSERHFPLVPHLK